MALSGMKHTGSGGTSGVLYTDRRDFYLRPEYVAELYPSVTPFTTMLSKLPSVKSKDPEFKLFEHESEFISMEFYVGEAIDWDSGGSYNRTYANLSIELTAGGSNAVNFVKKGDIIEIRAKSAGNRNSGLGTSTYIRENEIVARAIVTNVDSTTQIDIKCLDRDGSLCYDVVDQDPVRVISHADPEGSKAPDTWSDELTVVWGSTQIEKTALYISKTLADAALRGYSNELAFLRAEKGKEHKWKLEGMYLMGQMSQYGASYTSRSDAPSHITNPNSSDESYGNTWRTSWGIIPLLETYGTSNEQVFDREYSNYDMDKFIDDYEARSQYFNEDVNEYAFVGSNVLAYFSKTGSDSFFSRSGGAFSLSEWRATSLGFQVRTLTHPFGQTHLIWTPRLRGEPYKHCMVIVDPKNVSRVVYEETVYQTGLADNDLHGYKEQYLSDEGLGATLLKRHALWKFH